MKNKLVFGCGVLLAFGLLFTACKEEDDKGEYHLKWGVASDNYYSHLRNNLSISWTTSSTSWALAIGSDATNGAASVTNYISDDFDDSGNTDGSFAACIGFSKNGIGAPDGLKEALTAYKDDAPLAGIARVSDYTVLFYITKN
jgi:hypothetical protein